MRRGRGAAGGGGQEFVFEEEEPGEERQRQDEAAEGQCAIGAKVVDDGNGKKKRVETGGLRFWCELGFCFPAASGDKNSVTDASSRRSGDEIN